MNKNKLHPKTNSVVINMLEDFKPDYILECHLWEYMQDRGLSLEEVSRLTGLRVGTISEIANLKRGTINIFHILVIAKALRILDIRELLSFEMSEETRKEFKKERRKIDSLGVSEKLSREMKENKAVLEWERINRGNKETIE